MIAAALALAVTGLTPPPAQYEARDTQAVVRFMDQDDVDPICRRFGIARAPRQVLYACTLQSGGIIMPSPQSFRGTGEAYRALMLHELGHENGWPADHSDPPQPILQQGN